MRLLAIETATTVCSVALIDDGTVVDSAHAVVGRGHAERLLPMIAGLAGGGRPDAIVVDCGPGSFTGIRVGIAAARALGFAWEVPVHGFVSLALIAAIDGERRAPADRCCDTTVTIEGGHGEVFVGQYRGWPIVESAAPQSLAFDTAVETLGSHRIVGNAAARIVAARGSGCAVACDPEARGAALLPQALASAPPRPFYGRAADAKPMA